MALSKNSKHIWRLLFLNHRIFVVLSQRLRVAAILIKVQVCDATAEEGSDVWLQIILPDTRV
jgi:hypothetical protein